MHIVAIDKPEMSMVLCHPETPWHVVPGNPTQPVSASAPRARLVGSLPRVTNWTLEGLTPPIVAEMASAVTAAYAALPSNVALSMAPSSNWVEKLTTTGAVGRAVGVVGAREGAAEGALVGATVG